MQQAKLDYWPQRRLRDGTIYYLVKHGTYEYLPDYQVSGWAGRGKTLDKLTPEQRASPSCPRPEGHMVPRSAIATNRSRRRSRLYWTIDMMCVVGEDGRERYFRASRRSSRHAWRRLWVIEKLTLGRADFTDTPGSFPHDPHHRSRHPFSCWSGSARGHLPGERVVVRAQLLSGGRALGPIDRWSITLNNHAAAAFTACSLSTRPVQIWYENRRAWVLVRDGGFCAAFHRLPGIARGLASPLPLCGRLVKDMEAHTHLGLPAAGGTALAGLLTNYLAIDGCGPPYMDFGKPAGSMTTREATGTR